jgi:hypothetical protein
MEVRQFGMYFASLQNKILYSARIMITIDVTWLEFVLDYAAVTSVLALR